MGTEAGDAGNPRQGEAAPRRGWNMNILITGAYGFVGTNLSAFLAERGHELWALDVESGHKDVEVARKGAKTPGRAYTRSFDWGQLGQIPWGEVDAVVHLAGKAHDTKNASDPQSYFDVNVGLTKKVMQSAMGSWQSAVGNRQQATGAVEAGEESSIPAFQHSTVPGKKFILFSSVKAVADRVEGVLTEEATPAPMTPYGQSKLEAEGVVRSAFVLYCESSVVGKREKISDRQSAVFKGDGSESDTGGIENRYLQDKRIEPLSQTAGRLNPETSGTAAMEPLNQAAGRLNYYILRPCMIHGPGNKGNLNLLYGMVRRGLPWPLGAFENRRSFAAIGNVCAVVEGLLAGDVAPGAYQVADDEALPTNELVRLMAESLGRRTRVWRIPGGLVRAAARIGDVLRLPLNSERLKKLTESYVVSNDKIKQALGWERMPVSARDGMRETLESFGQPAIGNRQ